MDLLVVLQGWCSNIFAVGTFFQTVKVLFYPVKLSLVFNQGAFKVVAKGCQPFKGWQPSKRCDNLNIPFNKALQIILFFRKKVIKKGLLFLKYFFYWLVDKPAGAK